MARLRIGVSAPDAPSPEDVAAGLSITPWMSASTLEQVFDPHAPLDADFILVPFVFGTASASPFEMHAAMRRFLGLLPHFLAAPSRHLILDNTDLDVPFPHMGGAVLFKTSASVRDAHVLPLPYLLPDPGPPAPVRQAELDLAFQGSLDTHPIRDWMDRWRHSWRSHTVEVKKLSSPFWMMPEQARAPWAASYAAQLKRTRFVLCPRGRALNSRRFFEALAYGRVPVLITDGARLPLTTRIDYDEFVVTVPEGFGRWTPDYVADFLARHELEAACRLARRTWLEWFAPERFHHFLSASLADAGHAPHAE